jgi:SET domain-containing protein
VRKRSRSKDSRKRNSRASRSSTRKHLNSSTSGLTVRRSRIHGRGVFSTQPIRKGTRIIEYTGRRILWSSVPEEVDDQRTYYFGLDNEKQVIDPSIGGNEARFINHSCDPNCEAREDHRERVFIHALRNIRAGEELFYDYRLVIDAPRTKELEAEAPCRCGSPKCRGTLLEEKKKKSKS